jgi:hypothetical protein
MFLSSTALALRDEENGMFPITPGKLSVVIPGIVLSTVVCVVATPAVTEFTTVAAHAIRKLLSSSRYPGEPGLGSVIFVPGVLFLSAVMGARRLDDGISDARWRSSPSKPWG